MTLSRRQLRGLINEVLLKEQSSNPGSEPEGLGTMKTSNTYTYKNDGYTYLVMDDMWYVIRGKKKSASSTKDYISMEKYPDNMFNLDKAYPEARSSSAKGKNAGGMSTDDRRRGQEEILSQIGDQQQDDEIRGEQIDAKMKEIKDVMMELKALVSSNENAANLDMASAKSREPNSTAASKLMRLVDSPEHKTFKLVHKTISKEIQRLSKSQVADPESFKRLFTRFKSDYREAGLDFSKLVQATGSKKITLEVSNMRKIDEKLKELSIKVSELKQVQSADTTSSGTTSGESQVAAQRESLSRGSLYRRRYHGRY